MSVLGQLLNLLSSILTILLTCPNSGTWLCYSNDPFLTVWSCITVFAGGAVGALLVVTTVVLVLIPVYISCKKKTGRSLRTRRRKVYSACFWNTETDTAVVYSNEALAHMYSSTISEI